MKQRLLVAAIGVPLLIVVLVILPPVAAWILTAAIAAAAPGGRLPCVLGGAPAADCPAATC